jgi:lipopolysaccharide export system protein LptA
LSQGLFAFLFFADSSLKSTTSMLAHFSGRRGSRQRLNSPVLSLRLMGFLASLALLTTVNLLSANRGLSQSAPARQPLTLKADVQQANALTGVVTARGNVRLLYPARQIDATAAQAQYFSRERRIVLSGNVLVLQEGNTLRADSVTYLIDEERFVALPQTNRQVESVIMIQDRGTAPRQP